jgi:thiosulfate dehydrogenase [quinone] large subunit
MSKHQKIFLVFLRVSIGWLFFYSGITKVLDPTWSAAGYLNSAKTFSGFYHWLASPDILPFTNFLNEWGLTLIGIVLILGIFIRLASVFGAGMMILYYFPILTFPKVGANAYIIDEHIVYILVFLFLGSVRAGRIWGLDNWCSNLSICKKYPVLRKIFG